MGSQVTIPPWLRRYTGNLPWSSLLLAFWTLYYFSQGNMFKRVVLQNKDEVCDNLYDWVIQGGGFIQGVECVNMESAGGRGLYVTQTFPAGQTYLELPSSLWMYSGTIPTRSKLGPLLANHPAGDSKIKEVCGPDWDSHGDSCRLILAVDFEKNNPDSYWKEYIASLPAKPTALMFWNRDDVVKTQSETVLKLFDKQSGWYKEVFDELFPYLCKTYPTLYPDCSKYTLESLMISGVNVGARMFAAYQIEPNAITKRAVQRPTNKRAKFPTSAESTGVLLPFADLSNHVSNADSPYNDLETEQHFTLRTAQSYKTGAQLGFSYGSHHESTYFVDTYGFLPSGYLRPDFISIRLRDSRAARGASRTLMAFAGIDGEIVPSSFLVSAGQMWYPDETGIAATDKARKRIILAIKEKLDALPTTYQQDMAELQEGFKEYTQFVSVNIRHRFKRIYLTVIESLQFSLTHSEKPKPLHLRTASFLFNHERRFKRPGPGQASAAEYSLDQLTISNV